MKEEEARAIVRATLQEIGVDVADPIEVQKDLAHLRSHRLASEKMGMALRLTMLGILVSGAAGALWVGIKAALYQGPPSP